MASIPNVTIVPLSYESLESRNLFKTLLHGFRTCMAGLKKVDAPASDGTLILRLFVGCIRCLSLLDLESRVAHDPIDPIEMFSQVMLDINLHVFQEVWTHQIEFFFETAQKKVVLLNVCQSLFTRDAASPTLLAIVLKFLVDRLPLLGEYDDLRAAATIRLFKMAFHAVSLFPATNEPILAAHLAKLLMDCFPLATKATKPTHYFHLLRALFRAIGGGGGRFELLYKEVLPLLPEMLVSLNRQLIASEGPTRDLIVELCLTVPLRLTHLLPHLTYLMQPLALALKGSPELVSQGLRTLELCIDNLTPDFLDPTLNTVLRELMEALHGHLKPLPANHHVAHTTIRILGKLGGRNRRLLAKEPALQFQHHSEPAKILVSFGGVTEKVVLGPVSTLACRTLQKGSPTDAKHAFAYMENCLASMLHDVRLPNLFVTAF
jgi:transformation/transcription domain-associated protein